MRILGPPASLAGDDSGEPVDQDDAIVDNALATRRQRDKLRTLSASENAPHRAFVRAVIGIVAFLKHDER